MRPVKGILGPLVLVAGESVYMRGGDAFRDTCSWGPLVCGATFRVASSEASLST